MSQEKPAGSPDRKLFYGLFIFPLVIAVGMAVLLCAVVFLTSEKEDPGTLISSIKSGVKGKRWQKAFELSNELNLRPDSATPAILKEVLHIFNPANGYDPKTRAYIALALGRFKDPSAIAALENALSDENPDVQIYSLWSLGKVGGRKSANAVLPLLQNENAELRKTAAYVLGVIGDSSFHQPLQERLADESPDVRWNAALALARLGNSAGGTVLTAMLDRKSLEEDLEMSEDQIESAMINAIKGLVLIRSADSITILESVAASDRNLKVRQAAIDALNAFKKK